MGGHMGVSTRTQHNLLVHRIDTALNVVYVRGCVPGVDDGFVSVRDAKKKVGYKALAGLRKGKAEEEWLGNGVLELPVPAGTVERQVAEGWPQVVEFIGEKKVDA